MYCFVLTIEPFMIAFAETTYTVMESEGQVEVCINFTHPDGITDFTIFVESYNNSVYIPSDAVIASESPVHVFTHIYTSS